MVAITVVLAAVLYVMVMGPNNDPTPLQASLNADEGRLVLTLSRPYDLGDNSLSVTVDDGEKLDLVPGTIAGTVTFVDSGEDGKVGSNDYFTNSSGDASTIKIIWTSGDVSQVIAESEI